MRRKQYMKQYMQARRRLEVLERKRCYICGADKQLVLLDGRDKAALTTTVLDRLKACCLNCLFKDQPLLGGRGEANK